MVVDAGAVAPAADLLLAKGAVVGALPFASGTGQGRVRRNSFGLLLKGLA